MHFTGRSGASVGLTEKTISQLVSGATPTTYEAAACFELALGLPARFWNAREMAFREAIVKHEESKRLETAIEWLKLIPVKELIARNLIPDLTDKALLVRESLKFFGVSSIEAWHNAWGSPCVVSRRRSRHKAGICRSMAAHGDIQAEAIETPPYDAVAFKKALVDSGALLC